MTSHTPGPWSSESGNGITADFGGVGIAIVEPLQDFWCGDCSRLPEGAEMAANANLIAAAPDLMEACEAVLAWLTNVNTSDPLSLSQKLIAALRKAGYDESRLDDAAVAMLGGAARYVGDEDRAKLANHGITYGD